MAEEDNNGKVKKKMKRIESLAGRQVTFSKRRKGLFKKAAELSILCDAQVAVITFTASGNLFEYSSSSMKDIQAKYARKKSLPALEHRTGTFLHPQRKMKRGRGLSKKCVIDEARLLSHLNGEDLQDLDANELSQLEGMLKAAISLVHETKDETIERPMNVLQTQLQETIGERNLLLPMDSADESMIEEGQTSSGSYSMPNSMNDLSVLLHCSPSSSDTTLRLGPPFPT